MSKILNYISDLFVFWNLKKISNGSLSLIDSKDKKYFFGDNKSLLRAKINLNPRTEKNIRQGFHKDNTIDESFTSVFL